MRGGEVHELVPHPVSESQEPRHPQLKYICARCGEPYQVRTSAPSCRIRLLEQMEQLEAPFPSLAPAARRAALEERVRRRLKWPRPCATPCSTSWSAGEPGRQASPPILRVVDEGFTTAQLEVITAPDGPLGIIAGPGCGKTTVLAGRIAFLIRERGFDPSSILAVSFTSEAARALRAQVGRQLGSAATDVSIHTLHALGRRVIDTWAGRLGFHDRPAVLHPDERRALLRATAAELGWNTEMFSLSELAAGVDRCRLVASCEDMMDDPFWPLARAYEERLRRHAAIDFVAMLGLPLRLFREYPDVLRLLQLGYRCVLVDEAQDLDPTQWAFLELLAAEHRNLVVLGDPAQCIYGWRSADFGRLLHFADRYPDARVVTLSQSHRSTGHLVELANALSDLLGYRKGLVTDNPPGPAARLLQADDEAAEAAFVAHQIGALVDRRLLDHPGHAAVLYRTRTQADGLASALRAAGVPYRTRGHADLIGQRAVRDVLAYLRLAWNPADRLALVRALEVPPRGLGRLAGMLVEEPVTPAEPPALADAFGPTVKRAPPRSWPPSMHCTPRLWGGKTPV
jgi:DNA helicase-2/ATP-dependent DNA helicase PcrA